jgi:hypothetical protein
MNQTETEENLLGNHTISMDSEIHTKRSFIEETQFYMNSILYKGKNEGRNIKSSKSQDYS